MIEPPRAWAEVDLGAIGHNLAAIRGLAGGVAVMAVIKADGYGHGAAAVARAALAARAEWLAVATVEEGRALRASGIEAPVLVLGPAWGDEAAGVEAGLSLTVVDGEGVGRAAAAAGRAGRAARVHLKIETGMTRLGARPEQVDAIMRLARSLPQVIVEGVFTHLAAADIAPAFTHDQLDLFTGCAEVVRAWSPNALRHAASTAAALALPEARFDLIRIGLGLYGYLPSGLPSPPPDGPVLQPAMRLWGRVAQVQEVVAGTSVSYGRTYRTRAATRVATVALGYADGYPRSLGNRGRMLIDGRSHPVAGRVCMDYTMLDVGDGSVAPGAAALAFGPELPADGVAALAGTISYELLCRVGGRVPRLYT